MIVLDGDEFLTVEEAAARLGIKPASLYAYVSRGVIRSYRQGIKRQRLYRRAEVEALLRVAPAGGPAPVSPAPPDRTARASAASPTSRWPSPGSASEEASARAGAPRAPGPGAHREVAGAHLRADAPLRPEEVELPMLRPRGGGSHLVLGRVPGPAARGDALRHPLRDAMVAPRQPLRGGAHRGDHAAGAREAGGALRPHPRRSRLHHQSPPRRAGGR